MKHRRNRSHNGTVMYGEDANGDPAFWRITATGLYERVAENVSAEYDEREEMGR